MESIASYTSNTAPPSPQFHLFGKLSEELMRNILSFVADGPMEIQLPMLGPIRTGPRYSRSTLTNILPLVNKTIHRIVQAPEFWEQALKRQLKNDDNQHLWLAGLHRFLPFGRQLDEGEDQRKEISSGEDLLEAVQNHLSEFNYKSVYQKIFCHHIRFQGPIFIMPSNLSIAEPYGLHLFEPRYRIMIANLLQTTGNPETAGTGQAILPSVDATTGMIRRPLFIHACLNPRLTTGDMACLVQLVSCLQEGGGRAVVQLVPVAWVRLDKLWVKATEGHLYYANATRL